MSAMPKPRFPHLRHETSRHGTRVWYVRIGDGPRTRLRAAYGTEAFWEEYRAAIDGTARPAGKAKAGTFRWLVERYKISSAYRDLKGSTRTARDNILKGIVDKVGDQPIAAINRASIEASRDARRDRPEAANSMVKTLRVLFGWGMEDEVARAYVKANPAAQVAMIASRSEGFHTWNDEEVATYEAKWPLGTRERLALDVLLYTGLRRGDAVQLGRQHVRNGIFSIKTEKTGEWVVAPVLEPLQRSIDATKTGDLVYLVTSRGEPWSKESFTNWFRKCCKLAGVPGSAHGLRKAGASRAAENGATEAQLNALFGWKEGSRESATYVRKARRNVLAMDAAQLLLPDQKRNKSRRTSPKGAAPKAKKT
jgi:integrase